MLTPQTRLLKSSLAVSLLLASMTFQSGMAVAPPTPREPSIENGDDSTIKGYAATAIAHFESLQREPAAGDDEQTLALKQAMAEETVALIDRLPGGDRKGTTSAHLIRAHCHAGGCSYYFLVTTRFVSRARLYRQMMTLSGVVQMLFHRVTDTKILKWRDEMAPLLRPRSINR